MVGGQEIILKTQELRRSIEGMPPQAEGVIHTKANFRLEPGRQYEVIEILPPGKKFEVYDRWFPSSTEIGRRKDCHAGKSGNQSVSLEDAASGDETSDDQVKKDVWYKVKIRGWQGRLCVYA